MAPRPVLSDVDLLLPISVAAARKWADTWMAANGEAIKNGARGVTLRVARL
jgi:hypothetical protein